MFELVPCEESQTHAPAAYRLWDEFSRGADPIAVMQELLAIGDRRMAIAVGQTVAMDPCWDECADDVRVFLEQIDGRDEYRASLRALAAEPTKHRWDEIMRFVPVDDEFERLKIAVRILRAEGVDPDFIFECVAARGEVSDLVALAESGAVSPALLERHARRRARDPWWLGVAAKASLKRGETWNAVRLLRDAWAKNPSSAGCFISDARLEGDGELNAIFDAAGLPSADDAIDEVMRR